MRSERLLEKVNFDKQNRLLSATVNGGTASASPVTLVGVSSAFEYDYRNRQVSRTIDGVTTCFVYDGWNLIAEYSSSGTTPQVEYLHGAGIDELILKKGPSGNLVYYYQDGLGSTTALTDFQGLVVERYTYDVFGSVSITDQLGGALTTSFYGNRFLFTGREWIAEIGLYDYRNRVYSPELGRFLQSDPIRFDAGDVNIYRYVGNNSVNASDSLGSSGLFPYGTNAIQNLGAAAAKLGPVAKGTGLGGFTLGYFSNYDKFLDCLDKAADNLGKNLAKCCPTDTACQALANAIYASECAACAQTQIANSLGADQIAAAISNGLNMVFPGSK